jgi:sec-independent protein translocase protein TatA
MFGIGRLGPPELILILLIALLIFGPRKLPEIGRAIGKAFRELRSQARRADSDGSVDEVSSETDTSSEEQSTHEQ